MSVLKDIDATARRFERLKYRVKLVKKTRRATLRVSGQGWDRDGAECDYELTLELELDGRTWRPMPIKTGYWDDARSWLVTRSGTLTARRPVVDESSLTWAFEQLTRRKPRPIAVPDLSAL